MIGSYHHGDTETTDFIPRGFTRMNADANQTLLRSPLTPFIHEEKGWIDRRRVAERRQNNWIPVVHAEVERNQVR